MTTSDVRPPGAAAVSIRAARRADVTAIGRLGAYLVREHHDFDPQRFIPATSGTEQGYGAFIGTQLEKPGVAVLVAERGDELLGYVYVGLEDTDYMALRGPCGAVYDIVVDPAHQGRGVGRMLLEAGLAALEVRGAPRVVLSTAERNEHAQRLFASAGFRRTMIELTRELGDGS